MNRIFAGRVALSALVVVTLASCGSPTVQDHSPPSVRFTTPLTGDHVHETITVGVRAQDRNGVLKSIDLQVNGNPLASSATDPLSIKWNTRTLPIGGPAELEAIATDAMGNQLRTAVQFVIDRGTLPTDKEALYSLINDGSLDNADNLLRDIWDLGSRSQPVYISPITWTEDPFDKYWRFIFYGLRPLADLSWAYYAMNDTRYRDKLIEILTSYLDYDEQRTEIVDWTFDDKHTSAFRAMALVNAWGKLSRSQDLSPTLAARLRTAALKIAGFLADPANFDDNYNHGFTEAAALLVVAANFPDSASAPTWQATALSRLDTLMQTAVDGDGVEVEKSPFYHFYVMNFANEIAVWASRFAVPVSDTFRSKAAAMTRYATYVAHPNGEVPLIGASVDLDARTQSRAINEILGGADPVFEYMRTGGQKGVQPTETNILFPESGHSILRSAFGFAGTDFDQQTHIVFNVGPYRTSHSHLDGLSLVYASSGQTLLVDSGLFAYEDGPGVAFFKSTAAHNTVVVDDQSQAAGTEQAGATLSGVSWRYQSGSHSLYDGVLHGRGVLLLKRDLALVLDHLESSQNHVYAQTWHFLPDAVVTADPTGAVATNDSGANLVVLRQAFPDGISVDIVRGSDAPTQGWYSSVYGAKVANTVATFRASGTSATFVTLIASGSFAAAPPTLHADAVVGGLRVSICGIDMGDSFAVSVDALAGTGENVRVDPASTCP